MLQIPELLAPAGDLERLRYAINYGADAVYCGLPEFGMRSAPANFTPEQLAEGVIYAHARGRKVYLTMNTLPSSANSRARTSWKSSCAKPGNRGNTKWSLISSLLCQWHKTNPAVLKDSGADG